MNFMDEIDQKILKELTKDVQAPFSKIAQKIGVSPQTVQIRYTKMNEEGAILRSAIIVDLLKLGYQGKAVLLITNASNHKKKETMDALKKMQDVFMETEIIGDFDVLAVAAIRDFRSAIKLVNKIRALPSVDHVDASLTTDTAFPVGRGFNELFRTEEESK
jgi:DNA-binding Lrp family transcriptional regulator